LAVFVYARAGALVLGGAVVSGAPVLSTHATPGEGGGEGGSEGGVRVEVAVVVPPLHATRSKLEHTKSAKPE